MTYTSNFEKFTRTFALRDSLYRSVGVIGNAFTISAISLLPGFGVKGLMIATSIQLLFSGFLEIPTSIVADKFGRSLILRIGFFLKIFISVALGFAIYFASNGAAEYVWIAFVIEALIDAIANSLISGSYQVAYLSLYNQIPSNHDRPPLFLKCFEYGIKFRLLFPFVFIAFMTGTFLLPEKSQFNFYLTAYLILGTIIFARVLLFAMIASDFRSIDIESDKSKKSVVFGLGEVVDNILEDKKLFLQYGIAVLFNFVCAFFLAGQAVKELHKLGLNSQFMWLSAIGTLIGIYFFRTFVAVRLYPMFDKLDFNEIVPVSGYIIFLSGMSLAINEWLIGSSLVNYGFFVGMAIFLFTISDALSRAIESSLGDKIKTEFKATWISFGNTFAYIVFGLSAALISEFAFAKANALVGLVIALCGIFLIYLKSINRESTDALPFKKVIRSQLAKVLSVVVFLIVVTDLISFAVSIRKNKQEIAERTSQTVLLGIKSSVMKGDLIEASNFLYSLKSGSFISCFKLKFKLSDTNDCELNGENAKTELDIKQFEVVYDGSPYGTIELSFDFLPLKRKLYVRLIVDIVISLIMFGALLYLFHFISKAVGSEIGVLVEYLSNTESSRKKSLFQISEFKQISAHLHESISLKNRMQVHSQMMAITKQVAHDIRSPLTALNMVVAGSRGIDPKSAALIRSSVNRITDIANNLIQSAKSKNQGDHVRETRKEMLAAVVEEIVSEKRLEYRTGFDKSVDLLIETDLAESYGAFAEINAYDFKRVISNLINNSVEAMKGKGIIKLKLFVSQGENKQVVLEITDTGPGFPAELLAKLGNTQVTQGKEDSSNSGSGLGTLHAAQVIRKYGGEIRFSNIETSDDTHTSESKHITGAKIDIFFKPTPTPEWFVPEIVINDETRFLVLDDDSSVVVMWKEKIRTLKLPGFTSKLETLIYVNADKFIRENVGWVEPNDIIIIDYEIMGDRRTGLEVMHEMYYSADGKTGNHDAFLVSSHYEDPKIQEKVKSLGMKIIPKSVVHLVPFVYRPDSVKQALPESHTRPSDPNASPAAVSVKFVSQQPENGYDAVLIDDSPEIRGAWEMHQCGRKLKCYSKPQDFLADCEHIHTSSGIYLDLDFGKHGKGVDFIESIYNKGFKNINIVTGYSLEHVEIPSKLRPMITNIAAKAPPWAGDAGIGHIFEY